MGPSGCLRGISSATSCPTCLTSAIYADWGIIAIEMVKFDALCPPITAPTAIATQSREPSLTLDLQKRYELMNLDRQGNSEARIEGGRGSKTGNISSIGPF